MVQQTTVEGADAPNAVIETVDSPRDAFVAARRQEILDAARRAFIARGFDGTSMQQIAAESGVSAGNIYRYFPNKEALIASVCEGCDDDARAMFAQAAEMSISPNAALSALGDHVWAQMGTDGQREQTLLTLEALLVAARNPEVGDASKRSAQTVLDGLTGLVEGAQAGGEIDADLDARGFATVLYALVSGIQLLQLQLGDDANSAVVWETQKRLLAPFEHLRDAD